MKSVERCQPADTKMVGEVNHVIQLNILTPGLGPGEHPHHTTVAQNLYAVAKYLGMPAAVRAVAQGSDELPHAFLRHEKIRSEGNRPDLAEAIAIRHPADRPTPPPVEQYVAYS